MIFPGFVGPSYVSQSLIADAEECINLFVEMLESPGAKARAVLYPAPGITSAVTGLSESPGRGIFFQDGRCFAVLAGVLYEIREDFTTVNRGAVVRNTNPATFASNGDAGGQLLTSSGDRGYLLTLATNVLTNPLTSGCTMVGFLDGYFVALDTDTSTLQASALLNGATWPGANVAQRNTGSDPWAAMVVNNRLIWLVGELTTDVYYNAGTSPFPFAPIENAFIQSGTVAPFSVAALGDGIIALGQDRFGSGFVWMSDGYTARRISTHAVEYALQGYSSLSDGWAYVYQEDGHTFYVLNLPSAGATWVWDVTTGLWHRRGFWNVSIHSYETARPNAHAFAFNQHLVTDSQSGTIYRQSTGVYTDADGNGLRRVRRAPHINAERKWIYFNDFELEIEAGVGLDGAATLQGHDPQVILRWSDDGGKTWSNDHETSAGKIGEYSKRVRWNRLGRGRDRVFEIVMTDPVPWRVIGAYLNAQTGMH